ncbi:MAG: cysteine synthase A [Deltaproteobacteria bacterium]|nr:cysteine synthase A [Deltaproteobacteria bacterium]
MRNDSTIIDCVGKTPIVRLREPEFEKKAQIWAKLELLNPGGSLKDRMCLNIIRSMESDGLLKEGGRLVEASCGNTAISLAVIAAARGYSLTLVMPETVHHTRVQLLVAYGADIVFTPASAGMKGAIDQAHEIADSSDQCTMLNQFENPANPEAHRLTTAVEILKDLKRPPDAFVMGVGTGGTITGVGEVLKKRNKDIRIVAVEPAESAVLCGGNPGPHNFAGIGAGFIPKNLNVGLIDEIATVSHDQAEEAVRTLAIRYGIYAGLSSGASFSAALDQASKMGPEKIVLTIICDAGERYVSFF